MENEESSWINGLRIIGYWVLLGILTSLATYLIN